MKYVGVGAVDGSCKFVVTGGVRNSVGAQPDSCCKIVGLHSRLLLGMQKKEEEIDCPRLNWVIDLFFFFGEFVDEGSIANAMMDHRLNNFAKV